jgi:hypothetical protein
MAEMELPSREIIRQLLQTLGAERTAWVVDHVMVAQVREFWLDHDNYMCDKAQRMIVTRGNELAAQLRATDNPLIHEGIRRIWNAWLANVERTVRRPQR